MTILAYEATAGADALLKKHGKQEAVSYQDLEAKLAKLYFDAPDKVALEKEMAHFLGTERGTPGLERSIYKKQADPDYDVTC